MKGEVVIETRNLSKVYRDFWGRPKVRALKALDLKVYKGEIFGLLGPNGSGKTTTIKLLLGLLFPTEGDALIFGEPTQNVAKNERIGYLPEESYLYKFLNAEETLHFYGRLFKMTSAERKKRVDRLIDLVGISGAKHRQLREYSKGMQRRIGLAQALINDPELILLDEPTSGLDPLMESQFQTCIRETTAQGRTVLLSSHILGEVEALCDRVSIVRRGRVVRTGTLEDLREHTLTSITASTPERVSRLPAIPGVTVVSERTLPEGVHTVARVTSAALVDAVQSVTQAHPSALIVQPPSLDELFLTLYRDEPVHDELDPW